MPYFDNLNRLNKLESLVKELREKYQKIKGFKDPHIEYAKLDEKMCAVEALLVKCKECRTMDELTPEVDKHLKSLARLRSSMFDEFTSIEEIIDPAPYTIIPMLPPLLPPLYWKHTPPSSREQTPEPSPKGQKPSVGFQ